MLESKDLWIKVLRRYFLEVHGQTIEDEDKLLHSLNGKAQVDVFGGESPKMNVQTLAQHIEEVILDNVIKSKNYYKAFIDWHKKIQNKEELPPNAITLLRKYVGIQNRLSGTWVCYQWDLIKHDIQENYSKTFWYIATQTETTAKTIGKGLQERAYSGDVKEIDGNISLNAQQTHGALSNLNYALEYVENTDFLQGFATFFRPNELLSRKSPACRAVIFTRFEQNRTQWDTLVPELLSWDALPNDIQQLFNSLYPPRLGNSIIPTLSPNPLVYGTDLEIPHQNFIKEQEKLEAKKEENSSLNERLEEVQAENDILKPELEQKKEANKNLNESLKKVQGENTQFAKDLREKTEELSVLKKDSDKKNKQLTDDLEDSDKKNKQFETEKDEFKRSNNIKKWIIGLAVVGLGFLSYEWYQYNTLKNEYDTIKKDLYLLPYKPDSSDINQLVGIWRCDIGSPMARLSPKPNKYACNFAEITYHKFDTAGYFKIRRWGPTFNYEGYAQMESKNLLSIYLQQKDLFRKKEKDTLPPKIRHSLIRLDRNNIKGLIAMSASWEHSIPEYMDDIIGIREVYRKYCGGTIIKEPIWDDNDNKFTFMTTTCDTQHLHLKYLPLDGLEDSILVGHSSFIKRDPVTPR